MPRTSSELGRIISRSRGEMSRAEFTRRVGYSYTFVRSLELGIRSPSDAVLIEIARRLRLPADDLIIAAYCDRSRALRLALRRRGGSGRRGMRR